MSVGLRESLCLSHLALGYPQGLQTHPWESELWTGVRPQTQTSCPALSHHCSHHGGLVVLVLTCLKSLSSPCAPGKQDWGTSHPDKDMHNVSLCSQQPPPLPLVVLTETFPCGSPARLWAPPKIPRGSCHFYLPQHNQTSHTVGFLKWGLSPFYFAQ